MMLMLRSGQKTRVNVTKWTEKKHANVTYGQKSMLKLHSRTEVHVSNVFPSSKL